MIYLHYCKYIMSANIGGAQIISTDNRELLTQNLGMFRRAIWHDMLVGLLRAFENFDFSLLQIATLYMLDDEGEPTIKHVAETLGRSVSATSRLLDQLVEHGLIGRREDKQDRRARRVFLTGQGRAFLRTFEQNRANAQLAIMVYLSPEEQAQVAQAMALLAEAARRRSHDEGHAKTGITGQKITDE
jgi:DNA-binding MarR family transcriptional regulator